MDVKIKKLPKSLIEITGEIPAEKFESARERAIKELSSHVSIDGFRKGMAPESVLERKLGAMAILEEMAQISLGEAYPEIVLKNKLDVIGNPEISITKIAAENPLGFKIISAIVPGIELPDYKTIAKEAAKKKEPAEVSDKEIDDLLLELRKSRSIKDEKSGEQIIPELSDEFARTLGGFENVSALKDKVRENMKMEKEYRAKEKVRLLMADGIALKTEAEIPEIISLSETGKMISRIKDDVEKMGMKFEDYLKNIKKTEDEMVKEWLPEGEKRAKIELALMKIAEKEKIKPTEEEIEKEIKHVLEHYKEAKEERVREYVASLLIKEKVFEFLENQ